jgi:hypothetical protein
VNSYVFNSQSKETLVGSSTNRTCLLDGRVFRVDLGDRGFLITPSRPLGNDQLTEQKAIDVAEQASHGEAGSKDVDLRELLKQERQMHLANPLFLQDVTLRPVGTNLVVNFVSATGLKGTVTLDQQLSVLSMTLTDAKK